MCLRLLLLYRLCCEAVAGSNLRPFFVPALRIHKTQLKTAGLSRRYRFAVKRDSDAGHQIA